MTEIKFIKNKNIDIQKWDSCVEQAANRKIYAFSWYLDIVAESWNALIFGDYEFVMPIPSNKKFGIPYIIQPPYCQQLGIFPKAPQEIQEEFMQQFTKSFKYIQYFLNAAHDPLPNSPFTLLDRINLVLPLIQDYESIVNEFTKHTKRNLKAAKTAKVEVVKGLRTDEFMKIKKENLKTKASDKALHKLYLLINNTVASGRGTIYGAYSDVNNLCSAAFILFDGNRVYYLNAFSTNEGRENRAMYAIVDSIIKEFAGSGRILDFEGSMVEGVARFYKGFGALQEKYFYLKWNKLPIIKSIMK